MPDTLPSLFAHPFAVVFHILGQSFGIAIEGPLLDARMDRLHVLELRRDLDHRLADHYGHRVQVRSIGGQAQALRLQRDRPTTRERIIDRRQFTPAAAPDFCARSLQDFFVGRVLPFHQLLDDLEQALAFGLYCLFGRELIREAGGVIHQLRKQHRPTRRQRPPRPPQVQGAGMPMPDRLLPRRRRVDRFQRDRDFDQFLLVGHFDPLVYSAMKRACRLGPRFCPAPSPSRSSNISALVIGLIPRSP